MTFSFSSLAVYEKFVLEAPTRDSMKRVQNNDKEDEEVEEEEKEKEKDKSYWKW